VLADAQYRDPGGGLLYGVSSLNNASEKRLCPERQRHEWRLLINLQDMAL
jgi:hypothetical protein